MNEQVETKIKLLNGQHIIIRQITGIAAKKVSSFVEAVQVVKVGNEPRLIRFGSRVNYIFPADAKTLVKTGEKETGSKSIIAILPKN